MTVYCPPQKPDLVDYRGTVFLAGSIDNGEAAPWQDEVIRDLEDTGADFFNPRCSSWDPALLPTVGCAGFEEQVAWETRYLQLAELRVFYFAPGSRSPITLLELGEFGTPGNSAIYAPPGYWRSGNVQLMARRRGIACFTDRDEFVEGLRVSLLDDARARRSLAAALAAASGRTDTEGPSSSLQPGS